MKKKKYILLIVLSVIIRINVYGANLSLELNCPDRVYSSTTIDCNIISNITDGYLKELTAEYVFDNSEYSKLTINEQYKLSNNLSDHFKINGTINSGEIGNLTVFINGRSKQTASITLNNIEGIDDKNNKIYGRKISKTVNIVEHDIDTNSDKKTLYLNSLNIEGYDINFNKNIFNYSLNVDYEIKSINITATSDYEISGTGKILLKEGENIIVIKVKDNDDVTDYTIKVNRETKASNIVNNNIEEINESFKSNKDLIVNLNKESDILKINKEVLDLIKDKKRTITYNILENNEVLYTYKFDGSKFKDFNNNISLELYLTKDKNGIYITTNYNGKYPKGTILRIKNINDYKESNILKLYDSNLNLIKYLKVNNDYIEFNINDGKDYIITNRILKINNLKNIIIMIVSLIAIIIILIIWNFSKKKKNKIEIPKLKDYIEIPKEKEE